jgi:hypothetical protein
MNISKARRTVPPSMPSPAQIVCVDALKLAGSRHYAQMSYLKTGYLLASFRKNRVK